MSMIDISALGVSTDLASAYSTQRSKLVDRVNNAIDETTTNENSFAYFLNQAQDLITETNYLSNQAEVEEINYALGYTDSTHDLQVAQEKANVALQYTVAVRDRFLESYNTIMNMTI